MKVTIVEYHPEWRQMFEDEKKVLQTALAEVPAEIEHIGSTSVIGLAAKPIIDIMVGLEDFSIADHLVPKIEAFAYEYIKRYEDVMPFRRFFTKEQEGRRTHQIHMVGIGTEFWERQLLFRDYLRQNESVAARYAALKKELAKREWVDVNEYADAKTEFIRMIESEARDKL
ncbi:MAG TPA: GrpB family protein [Pyrinomonadaceae bacterium]